MKLYKFSDLKSDFISALEESSSKAFLIENEIAEIHKLLNYDPADRYKRKGLAKYSGKPVSKRIFKIDLHHHEITLFNYSFHKWVESGQFQLERDEHENVENFKRRQNIVLQAKEFTEYYEWLISLKSESAKPTASFKSLSSKQRVLALHYLGLQFKEHDYSQVARLIEPIINVGWEDSRKFVQVLVHQDEKLKTKDNLKALYHLFDKEQFTDQAKQIKLDLEKLN